MPDAYGAHLAYDDNSSEGVYQFVYPATSLRFVQDKLRCRRELGSYQPPATRELPVEMRTPAAIGVSAIAGLMLEADPRKIVFYTGAGISDGGTAPIRDHFALTSHCGFISNDELGGGTAYNSAFIRAFLSDPAKGECMFEAYQKMLGNLYRDISTPAHVALASIVRALKLRPSLITTNYDNRHEAEGSRLRAVTAVPAWNDTEWPDTSPARKARRLAVYRQIEEIQKGGVELLVAVGAAADRRGVIEWLDPETIVAINTMEARHISYLGKGDYIAQGDAQRVLPAIATGMELR